MSSPRSLLAQWRDANRCASEAEQAIFEASLMFVKGQGPEPTAGERRRTKELRSCASELLERAISTGGDVPVTVACDTATMTSCPDALSNA